MLYSYGGPVALLYFHGGVRGSWLAGGLAVAYWAYAGRKHSIGREAVLDSLLVFLLGGYTARLLLYFVWGEGSRLTLGLLMLLGAAVLLRWLYGKTHRGVFTAVQLVLLFTISHVVVTTLGSHRDWLQNKGFMFPVVFDSSGEITRIYKVSAFPTTFMIRPGGFMYKKHQGPMNETMLREAVGK